MFTQTTVLHPCHTLQYFKEAHWPFEWIDTAKKIIRDEFECLYMFQDARRTAEEEEEEMEVNQVHSKCCVHDSLLIAC